VSSDPRMGVPGDGYDRPELPLPGPAESRDVRRVPPRDAAVFGGHWATELRDGWVALTDTLTRRGLASTFPLGVFRAAWLWQVYGGWRGHYHVALEPWTGHPMQLDEAIANGTADVLAPGETREASVEFVVYGDRAAVTEVRRDGNSFIVR
jgi:hypothetical protein